MSDIYLACGLRTPFVKAGTHFAQRSALELSVPVARSMSQRARPDFLVWGQVIPDPGLSNIGRELVYEAELDRHIPAYATIMACSTSFTGTLQAAGMLGRGGAHLALVGGVESMSHVPIGLKYKVAERLVGELAKSPAGAVAALQKLTAADFDLPTKGWANRVSGRTMGEHMEDTAKEFGITRADQDQRALQSHRGAVAAQDAGFFGDLIVPVFGVDHDTFPRRDTSLEKLSSLPPVFDRASGSITAGNSSPLTDGAASVWVADHEGLQRLGESPAVRLVDWEIGAVDFVVDGMLMAPARAIPRLLARHRLRAEQIALWEIHEAFSAQVVANVKAASDPVYRREKAGVEFDTGAVPVGRINPNGGSVAIGHPFGATGARILSQAVKELTGMPSGEKAIVSVCADGGQGTVALLERV
ncbi:MAG TPA: acetyl-CoA C-acyltransferase [Steroidobacteraceae bacterium]|jgi:acetyl-CoA C-acetyltransferase/acetyl-CoA acyltransferase